MDLETLIRVVLFLITLTVGAGLFTAMWSHRLTRRSSTWYFDQPAVLSRAFPRVVASSLPARPDKTYRVVLNAASDAFSMGPGPRSDPISPLRLAADRYAKARKLNLDEVIEPP